LTDVIEVRFKGNRKEYFTWPSPEPLALHDSVIVEVDRGQDLGRVSAVGPVAAKKCAGSCSGCSLANPLPPSPSPQSGEGERGGEVALRHILRRATPADAAVAEQLHGEEAEVRRRVMERVRTHALPMKVSDAEWQWDKKKLTVYFTAERLDGVGRCGRQYCCSSWLPELRPVSLSLAKDQHLSLNPSQISGGCGRLLCCLRYEHDFYVQTRKRFPKEGRVLRTTVGLERVLAVDVFRETVTLRVDGGDARVVALEKLKDEVSSADA